MRTPTGCPHSLQETFGVVPRFKCEESMTSEDVYKERETLGIEGSLDLYFFKKIRC